MLIKTDLATDALPLEGTDVNEEAVPESALPGETPDVEAGKTGTLTVTLPPGRYVMLCTSRATTRPGWSER